MKKTHPLMTERALVVDDEGLAAGLLPASAGRQAAMASCPAGRLAPFSFTCGGRAGCFAVFWHRHGG